MTKFKVLTDRLNTFFTNNKITTGNSIPTSGEWNVGDICISSIQENGECGWICTESGTPGKWEIFGSGGSGKLVSLTSSVEVTGPVTEVSLTGLGTNVSENDKLFVHYNSTHLLEGVDFEIISNGTKIRKLGGGSWNESSSNAMFAFELLKHVKKVNGDNILLDSKMCVLKSNKTISAPVGEVEVGIEGFNKDTDFLTVYVNSTYLTEGLDYNISSDSRKIVSLNGNWNEESLSDYRFSFVVIKEVGIINPEAVVGTENLKDGSVTMGKLGEDVIERLDSVDTQLEHIVKNTYLNIDDFGAKANDENFNNIDVINEVIQYAKINDVKTILIPSKTYYVDPTYKHIRLEDDITIKGMSKSSVIKVKNSISKWSTLFRSDSKNNIHYDNFTIDGNSVNSIFDYEGETEQVPIYANGGKNISITNMIIKCGGMWGINLFTGIKGALIYNNRIYFSHNNRSWEDVSCVYFEGESVEVYQNHIYFVKLNDSDWIPQTAIEIHGSYHNVYNNIVENFKTGCIIIPNQLLEYNSEDSENVNIRNNTFKNVNIGVSIWTGDKGTHVRFLTIENNMIRLDNSKTICRGIEVNNYDNSIVANSRTLIDSNIINNTIVFNYRNCSQNNREGDCGISLKCVTPIFGVNIEKNIINNCGGQGIFLHEVNYLNYAITDTNVKNNITNDVKYPIVLGFNLNNVVVTDNTFIERTIDNDYTISPISLFEKIPADNKGHNIVIKNNTHKSYNKTKLNLLEYDMSHSSQSFGLKQPQYVLEYNNDFNNFGYVSSKSRVGITIPIDNYFSLDNVNKKTFNTGVSTFGTLKDSEGNDVIITEWINNKCIKVSDAKFIKPNQLLALEGGGGSVFRDYYVAVWYVKDNYVFTFDDANYDFTKTDSGNPIGKKITYQSYSKGIDE